ncbi:precorrin-6A synthase (deacetylating) [Nocardioides albus]|uniref:Precorrin-6A synthase n=1 Tax=Nocardioides albus TaxID=1841 RepID=A0A7W5A782_9ACTN|nr:precorrin-6A synthase (deacetylating) [Nocardioides albus]MBB3091003.1 precorrin-6A synthase [Nocardioides albus]GGU38927.1 precorrin-6A synthase (deacetylating) [Nocardioides albus]
MTRTIKIIGVGPGDPDQVTLEAVAAMRSVDYFLVTDKSGTAKGGMPDPLVRAREELLDRHLDRPARVVKVADAPRERREEFTGTDAEYRTAVADWHRARVEKYLAVLAENPGDVGFLVWGDPAFYDSTIRVVDQIASEIEIVVDVIPGISSVQLLAARHRLVLHDVGRPLYVTTGRAVHEAVEAGHDNLVVMLNRVVDLPGLEDWRIWWGGNLGTREEELVAGTVGEVLPAIEEARNRLRDTSGWVMDIYLLRAPRTTR